MTVGRGFHRVVARGLLTGVVGVAGLAARGEVEAQFAVEEFVVTGGASAEGYQGNLPTVGVPVRDSTEFVSAAIGEIALSTALSYDMRESGRFDLVFDGGIRQFAARGFELKDYSPREWLGTLDLTYRLPVGARLGINLATELRGRQVDDRPPMPLFLQPGFRAGRAAVGLDVLGPRNVLYDLEVAGERSDFLAPQFAPQIRLLNREAYGAEAGATLSDGRSVVRLFVGAERSRYPKQDTFDATDPLRRDTTLHAGASWTHQSEYVFQAALEGRVNRSNSDRPEYDALTVRALFGASLLEGVTLNIYGAVTAKQYLSDSPFARLLPGEEADNASFAYVSLTRALARNLDGTLRMGWQRAETEIGGAYYQRFGGSFLLHFRPEL